MLSVRPGRAPQTNRGKVDIGAKQVSQPMTFPAPSGGLVTNYDVTVEQLGACSVVQNMYPTLTGLKVRGGSTKHAAVDPSVDGQNDSFTKIMLHMDGSDGSTTFTDSNAGGSSHTWTAAGNAQIDTADSKFGGASGLFDGTGDYITTPDHADFTLGSGDFTIDFWFKLNGGDGSVLHFCGQSDATQTSAGSAWRIARDASNHIFFQYSDGVSQPNIATTVTYSTVSNPGWHHLEVVRSGTSLSLYVDGVQQASGTISVSINDSAAVLAIGRTGAFASNTFNGWIDEMRLSVGVARHTANFTPPVNPYRSDAEHGDDGVEALFTYRSGSTQKMFAASEFAIYEVTSVSDEEVIPTPDVSGLTSGDWTTTQFTNTGTSVLVAANGMDSVREYDGSSWSTPSITFSDSTTSANLNFVFSWGNRLWFIKNSTMDLYYLATNAISGAATLFPLGGVFKKGGSALMGFTWSTDAGDGLDDKWVVVSSEGEVAVYSGTDPASATTFAKEQVYSIPKPLGKNAFIKIGGDVYIATMSGLIPMSSIVVEKSERLGLVSLSRPIEDEWRQTASTVPFGWKITEWPERSLAFVAFPSNVVLDGACFVFNTITLKWGIIYNWRPTCFETLQGSLFFGNSSGYVMQAESTGEDDGSSFSAAFLSQFRAAESFGQVKSADLASMHFRGTTQPNVKLFAKADNDTSVPSFSTVSTGLEGSSLWDVGLWDEAIWDGAPASRVEYVFRQDVRAEGETLALGAVIVSSGIYPLDIEARHGTMQVMLGEAAA